MEILASGNIRGGVDAGRVGTTANLAGLAAGADTLVPAADIGSRGLAVGADARDGSSVAEVGVDADTFAAALHRNIGEGNMTRIGLGAVSACTVEFAKVGGEEVLNDNTASTVVLDDLVIGVESTTTDDVRDVTRAGLLDGDSVFADISPPDIPDSAGATAVDTLSLGSTNDDIADGSTALENEDGVGLSSLRLALTVTAASSTVEALHASVERARDDAGGSESRVAGRGRERGGETSGSGSTAGSRARASRRGGGARGTRGRARQALTVPFVGVHACGARDARGFSGVIDTAALSVERDGGERN